MVVHPLDALLEALETVALDEPYEGGGPGTQADHLGVDIARDVHRHARVRDHHAVDVLDELAAHEQLDSGEDDALLEHVRRVRAVRSDGADVEPVRLDRRVADRLAAGRYTGMTIAASWGCDPVA